MLLELGLDKSERKPRPVNGDIELLQGVREATDVVFVPMAQKDSEHVLLTVDEIRDIWQDQVDAEHVLLWKHQAGIDDDNVILGRRTSSRIVFRDE